MQTHCSSSGRLGVRIHLHIGWGFLALLVLSLFSPVQAAQILFVSGAAALTPRDVALTNRLISALGHTVVVWPATVNNADARNALRDEATTNTHDLIFISESISSGNVGNALKDVAKPVIINEPFIYDDMLMTGPTGNTDYGTTASQTQVDILDDGHPLAAGLSGTITVYSAAYTIGWGASVNTNTAARVASVPGDPTKLALFGYEAGAEMVGLAAPARRVGCFLWTANLASVPYTPEAYALLDAAVNWGLNQTLMPPTVTLTNPAPGATFPVHASITIQSEAADADGSVASVTFYAASLTATNLIGEVFSEPFAVVWDAVPEDRYTLTAVATDNDGLTGVSAPVEIVVGSPPAPALLLVANLTLNAGDAAVRSALQNLGLPVVVMTAASSAAADAQDKSLVLVSSTINSGDAAAKFRDVTVPVITWEPFILDDLQMAGPASNVDFGTTNDQTQVNVVNAAHSLAAGLTAGSQAVVNGPETFAWGVPHANALRIANVVEDPDKAVVFAYETGAETYNGFVMPARRVALFMLDTAAANFSASGLALFEAAVNWARTPAAPALSIAQTVGGLVVSWPESATGYVLQQNPEVTHAAGWTDVTSGIQTADGWHTYAVAEPTGNLFFRLKK